jgi:lipopolysaccharide biosynthesis glycosyltransferase
MKRGNGLDKKEKIKNLKMRKNLLVTAVDKNYINQAKQLFSSVYWNAGWDGDYMLLAHEIPEKDLKWFRDKGILVKSIKSSVNFHNGDLPLVIYLRYNLFKEEFKKWEKIIFLDSDIIVRGSINELKKVNYFGAIEDNLNFGEHFLTEKPANEALIKKIKKKYKFRSPGFNAGVLIINTGVMENKTPEKLIALTEKYKKISRLDDQTILNIFFYKKWESLPPRYNLNMIQSRYRYENELLFNKTIPIILHFYGKHKPWLKSSKFYREWNENFKKADLIDLSKVQEPAINEQQIILNDIKLNNLKKYLFIHKWYKHFLLILDRNIGRAGILIKSIFPRLYWLLKGGVSGIFQKIDRSIGKTGLFIKKICPRLYENIKLKKTKIKKMNIKKTNIRKIKG